jgi:hypothetical protein
MVQMISTCRHGLRGRGEGVGTLWFHSIGHAEIFKKISADLIPVKGLVTTFTFESGSAFS